MSNRCFIYLVIASFFRFWGGYALGFSGATFFDHRYPFKNQEFATMNAVIIIGGGLSASMVGGTLSDKLEDRVPMIKGLVSGGGALLATPFIFFTFIV